MFGPLLDGFDVAQEVQVSFCRQSVGRDPELPQEPVSSHRLPSPAGRDLLEREKCREDAITGLICSFPRWSPEAVITEAARNWNLLHPSQPFDPEGGDWAFTRTVIDS